MHSRARSDLHFFGRIVEQQRDRGLGADGCDLWRATVGVKQQLPRVSLGSAEHHRTDVRRAVIDRSQYKGVKRRPRPGSARIEQAPDLVHHLVEGGWRRYPFNHRLYATSAVRRRQATDSSREILSENFTHPGHSGADECRPVLIRVSGHAAPALPRGPTSVGADIRALRKARGLTLTALAEQLDRSVGFLSQLERGLSEPSIEDLRALSGLFDVPLSFFFGKADADPTERGYVVRSAARRRLGDPDGGLSEELLSPDLGGAFEVIRSVFEPGARLSNAQTRATEEAGYVIEGCLDLWIGESRFRLERGDSFRFAGEPYRWHNPGRVPCVVIWVIAPPVY